MREMYWFIVLSVFINESKVVGPFCVCGGGGGAGGLRGLGGVKGTT